MIMSIWLKLLETGYVKCDKEIGAIFHSILIWDLVQLQDLTAKRNVTMIWDWLLPYSSYCLVFSKQG